MRCLLLLVLFCTAACAVPSAAGGAVAASSPVAPALQPFLGHHCGELHIYGANGVQTVPMGLEIDPIVDVPDQLRFVLVYGEGPAAQRRDYRLGLDDAATGRCHIDEQNGIVLAAWLAADELVSAFTVQGQTNVVRYRATAQGIEFGLEALPVGEGESTGHEVRSHVRLVRQRALLHRTKG